MADNETLSNEDLDALLAEVDGMEEDTPIDESSAEVENALLEELGEGKDVPLEEVLGDLTENPKEEEETKEEKNDEVKEEEKEIEDNHPFDPKELKLHEIDETMLVKRRSGERNPHIEVLKKEDVELYEYQDMSSEVIEKKYKNPTGKEAALKRKVDSSNTSNVAQTTSGIGTNPNNTTKPEEQVQFDDSKLSKKLNQLGDGLRVGIKQLKDGIDVIKIDVVKNQGLASQIVRDIEEVTMKNLNLLKNDMNSMKRDIQSTLDQKEENNKILQEEIKNSLKEILNSKQREKEYLNDMINDLKDFSFKLIEKVIEKEVSENSSQIIKNTLDNMSKDFERISDITLYLSPSDEDLKEEMEKYLHSLYSGVKNIEIRIDKNLTKGSFFFNTDNGNAQSILKEKIKLIKEFL